MGRVFSIEFDVDPADDDEPDCIIAEFSVGDKRLRYYGTIEGLHSLDVGEWTIAYTYVEVDGKVVYSEEPCEDALKTRHELHKDVEEAYKTLRAGVIRSLSEEDWLTEVERRGNVVEP